MITNKDRRRFCRTSIVWKVVINSNDNIKAYIRDFSKQGIRLWINNTNVPDNQQITIEIPYPDKPELLPLQIDVTIIWIREFASLAFSELGCKFSNITAKQEIYLNDLMDFFKRTEHLEQI